MSDGVVVTLTLTVKPEMLDALVAGMPAAIKETAAFAGFREIRIIQNKDRTNELMFYEVWDSAEAHGAYMAWRKSTGALDTMMAVLSEPPKVDVWPRTILSVSK